MNETTCVFPIAKGAVQRIVFTFSENEKCVLKVTNFPRCKGIYFFS